MHSEEFELTKNGERYLKLRIAINQDSERIESLDYTGKGVSEYSFVIEELKKDFSGLLLSEAMNYKTPKYLISTQKLTLEPFWLIYQVLYKYYERDYVLSEKNDMLCLCYGVSRTDLTNKLLHDSHLDITSLVAHTKASTACGSCKPLIRDALMNIRDRHGLVVGLGQVRSRFDHKGKWFKIKQMYPTDLLIKIDELIEGWLKKGQFQQGLKVEIIDLEGFHVDLKLLSDDEKVDRNKVLKELNAYLNQELDVKLILNF